MGLNSKQLNISTICKYANLFMTSFQVNDKIHFESSRYLRSGEIYFLIFSLKKPQSINSRQSRWLPENQQCSWQSVAARESAILMGVGYCQRISNSHGSRWLPENQQWQSVAARESAILMAVGGCQRISNTHGSRWLPENQQYS
jgi:hypothetical protein